MVAARPKLKSGSASFLGDLGQVTWPLWGQGLSSKTVLNRVVVIIK